MARLDNGSQPHRSNSRCQAQSIAACRGNSRKFACHGRHSTLSTVLLTQSKQRLSRFGQVATLVLATLPVGIQSQRILVQTKPWGMPESEHSCIPLKSRSRNRYMSAKSWTDRQYPQSICKFPGSGQTLRGSEVACSKFLAEGGNTESVNGSGERLKPLSRECIDKDTEWNAVTVREGNPVAAW